MCYNKGGGVCCMYDFKANGGFRVLKFFLYFFNLGLFFFRVFIGELLSNFGIILGID